jgi:hypothetical protein
MCEADGVNPDDEGYYQRDGKPIIDARWNSYVIPARAALLADAPELVQARIDGMREGASVIRDNGVRYSRDGTSLCPRPDGDRSSIPYAEAIEARIAALQANLDKERGT